MLNDRRCVECNEPISIARVGDHCSKCCGETPPVKEPKGSKNKYHRPINWNVRVDDDGTVWIDVYDVLKAFVVDDQAVGHAIKKLLAPGQRGHKDMLKDLREARDSITRAIDMAVN